MRIVDGHEDLAYNIVSYGCDYRRSALTTRGLPLAQASDRARDAVGHCMLGLPEWSAAGVQLIFGTIFTLPAVHGLPSVGGASVYRSPEEAYAQAMAQMQVYERLTEAGHPFRRVATQRDLEELLAGPAPKESPIGLVIALEGAEPIRRPDDVAEWHARGVRIVGLSWMAGTRYAGGNGAPGPLTREGERLLAAMAELSLILDVSHLSDASCLQALARYDGPVIASHSSPRSLAPGPRQLSDEMIDALLERDGVIGICPAISMIQPGWMAGDPIARVTIDRLAAAIDYVCQRAGDAAHVALGTDFDGGFGRESAPPEIDTIADLPKIAAPLAARGYSPADVEAILGENWLRPLRRALPG